MDRTIRRSAARLRVRPEFDELLGIYARDEGKITLPQRIALQSLASFEEGARVTEELGGHHARREAVARAAYEHTQTQPPGLPRDAANLINPPRPPPPSPPPSFQPPSSPPDVPPGGVREASLQGRGAEDAAHL